MNLSLEWICQYVDVSDVDPERIAHRLTMSCAEVERLHQVTRHTEGVVVAEITETHAISRNGQHKRIVVDCGGKKLTTICTAPNTAAGVKTAFAAEGTRLSDGTTVSHRNMSGTTSHGVLCSAMDLGFSDSHEGVLELPRSMKNGTPLNRTVPREDTIIEIDNKSLTHRPDLWGHYGIARELAALFSRELLPLPLSDVAAYSALPRYPVVVEDADGCPCYACIELTQLPTGPSPLPIQWRLHTVGQRTINLPVDLTNYVMLELGQPMHAFDGRKVERVRVAPFGRNGTFTTLDGIQRNLLPEDLMIWSGDDPIALAGIMGGRTSEIQDNTTEVLLESASFRGSRIRRTASRLGMRTDASQRFEKNQPAVNTRLSIARFLHLLRLHESEPRASSRLTIVGNTDEARDPIEMSADVFKAKIGAELPVKTIRHILGSLGFESSIANRTISVVPPPCRSREDISRREDIIEEVARIYGYDRIEPQMPRFTVQSDPPDNTTRREHSIRKLLAASHGFVEVHTYAWLDDRWLETIGYDPAETLVVQNPSTEYTSRLRTTLMPNLLAASRRNAQHADGFRLFEIGRVFGASGATGSSERTNLSGLSLEQSKQKDLQHHCNSIKTAVTDVLQTICRQSPRYQRPQQIRYPWQTENESVDIAVAGSVRGAIGILPPGIAETISHASQIIWFEIDLSSIADLPEPDGTSIRYSETSNYPGSWQDFSIVWSLEQGFLELQSVLVRFRHPLVQKSDFIGVYQGGEVPAGSGSYTFRYWIGHRERTLEGSEIEAFTESYVSFLHKNGLRLRS